MGLYNVNCIKCKKPFIWFSANLHQLCSECFDEINDKKFEDETPKYDVKYVNELEISNETNFWNDDKVIDFVNWYIELHNLDFRFKLENRTIIDTFKNESKN